MDGEFFELSCAAFLGLFCAILVSPVVESVAIAALLLVFVLVLGISWLHLRGGTKTQQLPHVIALFLVFVAFALIGMYRSGLREFDLHSSSTADEVGSFTKFRELECLQKSKVTQSGSVFVPVVVDGKVQLCVIFGHPRLNLQRGDRLLIRAKQKGNKIYVRDANLIRILSRSSAYAFIEKRIKSSLIHKSNRTQGLVLSLVLGDKSQLSREQKQRYRQLGVSHFLAISGLHMSLVVGAVLLLLRILGFEGRQKVFLALVFVFAYGTLVGFRPAVTRAVIMATVFCLAKLSQRRFDALRTLIISAVLSLIYCPYWLTDIGFQLSYIIVAAIIMSLRLKRGGFQKKGNQWLISLKQSTWISAVAFLASAPLILHYFQSLAPMGILSSVICGPFIAFILLLSLAASCLSIVSIELASLLFCLVDLACMVLDWIMILLSKLAIFIQFEEHSVLIDLFREPLFPISCGTTAFAAFLMMKIRNLKSVLAWQ